MLILRGVHTRDKLPKEYNWEIAGKLQGKQTKRLSSEKAAARDPNVTAGVTSIGPALILDSISKELDIEKYLKKAFPHSYSQIMQVAYFLVQKGLALSHCESWCKSHKNPNDIVLTGQRISEMLVKQKEDERQTFFSEWSKKITEKEYLCYDITSVSSYSELNEYVKYGYNRDGETLPQINIAMLFGQKSYLPVYYKRLPGSVNDVITLNNLLKTFKYIDAKKLSLVMDKGFYSINNIDALFESNHKFTIAVPTHRKWVQEIIDEAFDSIKHPENYKKVDDQVLYMKTKLYSWGKKKRRSYVHIYFNAKKAAEASDTFMEKLITYKEELDTNNRVKGHEEFYERYFILKETTSKGQKIEYNNDSIEKNKNKYAGFFVLFTNDFKDPHQTLITYRNKDVAQNSFDDLKNQLDMKRLRVHGSSAMDGRLFIQFIALIYISALRNKMRENKLIEDYTIRELFEELDTIMKIKYSGRYGHIITELTKDQKDILGAFQIEIPT